MNNANFDISQLIYQALCEEISDEGREKLDNWLNQSEDNRNLYNKIIQGDELKIRHIEYKKYNKQNAWQLIEAKAGIVPQNQKVRFINVFRYAAAIILIVGIASITFFYFNNHNVDNETIANNEVNLKPGTRKARLILSGNRSVELSSLSGTSNTISETGAKINNNGQILEYSASENTNTSISDIYNTLEIPLGGEYAVQLSDSTKIWVNSATTLRFPVNFTDSVRVVYLEGEAFFDVAHNGKPFIVKTLNSEIRVLGTTFNVSAYNDNKKSATTLVTGKVQVTVNKENTHKILIPGQQASLENGILNVQQVDTELYTAWVKGKFVFNSEPIENVLITLSRWYNFKINISDETIKEYHFSGRLDKNVSLNELLNIIETTSKIRFELKEQELIVKK